MLYNLTFVKSRQNSSVDFTSNEPDSVKSTLIKESENINRYSSNLTLYILNNTMIAIKVNMIRPI